MVRLPHRRRPDGDTARGVKYTPAVVARYSPILDRRVAGFFSVPASPAIFSADDFSYTVNARCKHRR